MVEKGASDTLRTSVNVPEESRPITLCCWWEVIHLILHTHHLCSWGVWPLEWEKIKEVISKVAEWLYSGACVAWGNSNYNRVIFRIMFPWRTSNATCLYLLLLVSVTNGGFVIGIYSHKALLVMQQYMTHYCVESLLFFWDAVRRLRIYRHFSRRTLGTGGLLRIMSAMLKYGLN